MPATRWPRRSAPGTVVVRGDASTRAGIAMKGGMLIVAGNVGPMAGFMMQKGVLVVCGDAADGVADSMYAGTVFLGGAHGELGADAVFEDVTAARSTSFFGAALEQLAGRRAGRRLSQDGGRKATLELPAERTRFVEISPVITPMPARREKAAGTDPDS